MALPTPPPIHPNPQPRGPPAQPAWNQAAAAEAAEAAIRSGARVDGDTSDVSDRPNFTYPELQVRPHQPNPGQNAQLGMANSLRVQGTLRHPCPEWTPPEKGQAPPEGKRYSKWRDRFCLWAEGEFLLGVPPGLVARDLVNAVGGSAGDALLEIPRPVLYQARVEAADPGPSSAST